MQETALRVPQSAFYFDHVGALAVLKSFTSCSACNNRY